MCRAGRLVGLDLHRGVGQGDLLGPGKLDALPLLDGGHGPGCLLHDLAGGINHPPLEVLPARVVIPDGAEISRSHDQFMPWGGGEDGRGGAMKLLVGKGGEGVVDGDHRKRFPNL